jgi:predicted phage terminase large subunit-like protein
VSYYFFITADLAIGERTMNDYTCIIPTAVDHKANIFILPDAVRARLDAFGIVDSILRLACEYEAQALIIERGHISRAIRPLLNKRMEEVGRYFAIHEPAPTKDKVARARPLQGRMQQGKIHFAKGDEFCDTVLIPELLGFPAAKHDDSVDALAWLCMLIDGLTLPLPPVEGEQPRDPAGVEGTYAYYQKRHELMEELYGNSDTDPRERHRPAKGDRRLRDPWGEEVERV